MKVPVDFEEIELSSKNPGNEALENAITAIKRNGLALKVNYCCYYNSFLQMYLICYKYILFLRFYYFRETLKQSLTIQFLNHVMLSFVVV